MTNPPATRHPLDPLSAEEIRRAVTIITESGNSTAGDALRVDRPA